MLKIGTREFELDKLYEIDVPSSYISEAGQNAISSYLSIRQYSFEGLVTKSGERFSKYDYIDLNDTHIEYVWKTSRGTFPKRLSKYLYDDYKIILTPRDLEQIGNIAKDNSSEQNKFYVDFTQEFNWNPGDFGDAGSCFWGGNSGAREMLSVNGAYAIRFFRPKIEDPAFGRRVFYSTFTGLARAWLVKENFGFVMFNGYGIVIQQIANILATGCNLYYRKIELRNEGDVTGLLWIGARNGSSQGHGWVIGDMLMVKDITEHDFQWEELDSESCEHCGTHIRQGDDWIIGDSVYCRDCFNDLGGTCSYCGESCYSDYLTTISTGEIYCDYCRDRHCHRCDECGETFLDSKVNHLSHLESNVCNDCLEAEYSVCENCGESYLHSDLTDDLCEGCLANKEEA